MVAAAVTTAQPKDPEAALGAAKHLEEAEGNYPAAIAAYKKIIAQAGKNRPLAAKALVRMGQCYDKLGDAEARKTYERVVREFADQKDSVAEARKHLAAKDGPAENGLVARQVAKIGDRQYGPAISRDGRYLAFTNQGNIAGIHDLSTGEVRTVAKKPSPEARLWSALISPDGKYIAYVTQGTPDVTGLYVMGVDGSNPHRLAGGKDLAASPWGWSPDGKQVLAALYSKGKDVQVALVSIADASSRIVASQATDGRISPDGRYVALVRPPRGEWEFGDIVLLPIEGGREVSLLSGRYSQPQWMPDGKRLLAVADRNGSYHLWSVPVTSGAPGGSPGLVKTDVRTLIAATQSGECYFQSSNMARDLYVAGIDAEKGRLVSRPKQITSRDVNAGAAWSPDGKYLAFYAFRGPQGATRLTVVIRSTSSGEERELSLKEPLSVPSLMPQWFPDNRSLFVHSSNGGLRRLDVQTGEFRPLLEQVTITPYIDGVAHRIYHSSVLLAPDGRSIYYLVRDREASQTRILRRGLDGGPEAEVCRIARNAIFGVAISPDGSQLAFSAPDSGQGPHGNLWTVPTSGGEPKEVYRSPTQYLYDPVWTRDGRRLLVMVNYARGDIAVVPAEGGEAQPLGIGLTMKYFPNIHPDGKQIIFADEQWNNQLWVLKNLFGEEKAAR